ncbi:1497_t:CDS:2, partial [Racocetra fulgida]
MPRPNKRKQHTSKLSRKKGHFISENKIVLDVDIVQEELPQDEYEMVLDVDIKEILQVEPIQEITITQEKPIEVKRNRAPYTRLSRTTAWRRKQKVEVSSNIEASP